MDAQPELGNRARAPLPTEWLEVQTKLLYQGHGYAVRWFFMWLRALTGALMHEVYRNQTFLLIDIFCMRGDNYFNPPVIQIIMNLNEWKKKFWLLMWCAEWSEKPSYYITMMLTRGFVPVKCCGCGWGDPDRPWWKNWIRIRPLQKIGSRSEHDEKIGSRSNHGEKIGYVFNPGKKPDPDPNMAKKLDPDPNMVKNRIRI